MATIEVLAKFFKMDTRICILSEKAAALSTPVLLVTVLLQLLNSQISYPSILIWLMTAKSVLSSL